MTREELMQKWEQMTPRERDALIAEKVMGWKPVSGGYRIETGQIRTLGGSCSDPGFDPSRHIYSAWEVVEKCEKLFPFSLFKFFKENGEKGWGVNWCPDCYDCESCEEECNGQYEVEAPTAPEAICLAALLAVLDEVV